MDTPERALIERCQQGDREAWDRLAEQHYQYVFRAALGYVKNRDDASDVTQQVFATLVRKISSFQFGSSFRTFLFTVTRNTSLNYLKSRGRIEKRNQDLETAETGGKLPPCVDTPESAAVKSDMRRRVVEALQQLPDIFRNVLVGRYIGELSYEEIAQSEQIPLNTVRTRLSRGLVHLGKLWDKG